MERKKASEYDQRLLDLYDDFAHGRIDRRGFLEGASAFAVGGLTAAGILAGLSPTYAWAEQVPKHDPRIASTYVEYDSPEGGGKMRGLLVKPSSAKGKLPGVLVVHENRGLNPYIEDVARRLAVAGFLALAPDALAPLGGYPGNDDDGRTMQRKRDREEMTQDFIAGAKYLQKLPDCTGKVGVVGFCFGGGMANQLAVRIPDVIAAAVPFYGAQPEASDVAKIKSPLLLHYGELDRRINAGWPAYEKALKENGVKYEAFIYEDANHGFHNDTTPRYDDEAANLAWKRTIEFFKKNLG
ncbi:Carboxymethylenebutenolidase [Planctomycetes bacterium Pan216]|uniref:Carboxymethylenebutenolidase n=1 Tax=Kolteria novifilia TaxID=2527975 RepID=A0A518B3W9_9BACT|nr:Carboxymethylenebutenolidase [Planctomycetes bacterium Pan216]